MLPGLMSFLLACFVLPPLRLGSESHKHHLSTLLYYSGQRVGIYQVQILAGHNGFMALLSKDRIDVLASAAHIQRQDRSRSSVVSAIWS